MEALKLSREFVRDVLNKEKWFRVMKNHNDCDLLLLAGTATKKLNDSFSDIDIFVVCKYKAQIEHSLMPVRTYNYSGEKIELSVVSTEKLFNDRYAKENLYWWHKTRIIKSFSDGAEKALEKASILSKKEFLDRIWTNFVNFEINSFSMEKQMKRNEPLSVSLLFFENIRFVIDSFLVNCGKYPNCKWLGGVLKQINKKAYDDILKAQYIKDFNGIKCFNIKMRKNIIGILKNNGFTEKEINNWEGCNLKRITFQYR